MGLSVCIGKGQTDEKKEKASETDSTPKFSFVLSRKRTRTELGMDDSGIVAKRESVHIIVVIVRVRG